MSEIGEGVHVLESLRNDRLGRCYQFVKQSFVEALDCQLTGALLEGDCLKRCG
jgi:hypothetical protein